MRKIAYIEKIMLTFWKWNEFQIRQINIILILGKSLNKKFFLSNNYIFIITFDFLVFIYWYLYKAINQLSKDGLIVTYYSLFHKSSTTTLSLP